MDKKKLARLLALVGGILMAVTVALWFIPTMNYTYTDRSTKTEVTDTISPMGYFAQGADAASGYYYKNVMSKIDGYNTNQDMYWLAFGVVFAVVGLILVISKGHKFPPKAIAAIFAIFILCGVIFSTVLKISFLWPLYLVIAILAVIASVGGAVIDYIA